MSLFYFNLFFFKIVVIFQREAMVCEETRYERVGEGIEKLFCEKKS